MTALIQIVARLPPHVDGVGDYAMLVARELRVHYGIATSFLACSPRESESRVQDGFDVKVVKERHADALYDALLHAVPTGPTCLVYHFSGYGYSADGAPRWLVQGLRRFMLSRHDVRLATVFHELYATSMPWRRAFWHSARQRAVGRSLAQLSDHGLCTIERNFRVLHRWQPTLQLSRLPISSNIPVLTPPPAWSSRAHCMAIFGLPGTRKKVYDRSRLLLRLCRSLNISTLVDIGEPLATYPAFSNVEIVVRGVLSDAQVSEALGKCRFGFLDYTATTLAKSGVMAAYCSHGLVPVIPVADDARGCDGLVPNMHFVAAAGLPVASEVDFAQIAAQARQWYDTHNVHEHASWYRSLL